MVYSSDVDGRTRQIVAQGDHLSGKPGNIREFDSCQGNVRDFTESQGKAGESCLKLFIVS